MNANPTEKEIEYIRASLYDFNKNIVGDDGHTPLNIVEYDGQVNIVGGDLPDAEGR